MVFFYHNHRYLQVDSMSWQAGCCLSSCWSMLISTGQVLVLSFLQGTLKPPHLHQHYFCQQMQPNWIDWIKKDMEKWRHDTLTSGLLVSGACSALLILWIKLTGLANNLVASASCSGETGGGSGNATSLYFCLSFATRWSVDLFSSWNDEWNDLFARIIME